MSYSPNMPMFAGCSFEFLQNNQHRPTFTTAPARASLVDFCTIFSRFDLRTAHNPQYHLFPGRNRHHSFDSDFFVQTVAKVCMVTPRKRNLICFIILNMTVFMCPTSIRTSFIHKCAYEKPTPREHPGLVRRTLLFRAP
jgi:hypothetical protein